MKNYSAIYKEELLQNIIPFWMNNSIDPKGGYFTCLDRTGKVYDTDKFIWLQGRQIWMFSSLYYKVKANPEWLKIAGHGADFMKKHGRDKDGNWYFSLDQNGKPLVQAYNIFSDCFAAMAFGALYKIKPEDEYAEIAASTFENILKRRENPKGKYNKIYPGTRDLKNFALPMILSNLSIELEHILDKNLVNALIEDVIREIMEVFYQPDSGLILENVCRDGTLSDSFEGRLVNPGHVIEAMWFIMDLGIRLDNESLIDLTIKIALRTLEFGWDTEYGGILYFKDIKEKPLQQLEWDQKLWWVHVEALVCMAKAYTLTGNKDCLSWFEKIHEYTWTHFRDSQYGGEWYGYLNRTGEVLNSAKGGKWKGCFHIPRGLYQVWNTFENQLIKRDDVTAAVISGADVKV